MNKFLVILAGIAVSLSFACQRNIDQQSAGMKSVDTVDMLTRQIKKDSADYQLFLSRARVYLNQGAVNPAFRDVNRALDLNKQDPEVYSLLADLYFIIGKSDDAIGALNKSVELAPGEVKYVVKLARIHIMLRSYDTAYTLIERALAMDFQNSEVYYLKGIYLLERGDTLDAITHMKIAGSYDTAFYESFMHAASLLNKLNDSTSIDYFQAALKARPDDAQALFLLGLTYQDLGRYDDALACYEKLMVVDPGHKQVHYNMGYIFLVEFGDYERAAESFQAAISIDPAYVDAVYNLGRTYEAMRRYDEAKRQYRMALEIRTNYDLAIEGLNRLESMPQ